MKIVKILHQTKVYAALILSELACLQLRFWYFLQCSPKPYVCPRYNFSSPNLQTCFKSWSDIRTLPTSRSLSYM